MAGTAAGVTGACAPSSPAFALGDSVSSASWAVPREKSSKEMDLWTPVFFEWMDWRREGV
jgi:hypothetical protein